MLSIQSHSLWDSLVLRKFLGFFGVQDYPCSQKKAQRQKSARQRGRRGKMVEEPCLPRELSPAFTTSLVTHPEGWAGLAAVPSWKALSHRLVRDSCGPAGNQGYSGRGVWGVGWALSPFPLLVRRNWDRLSSSSGLSSTEQPGPTRSQALLHLSGVSLWRTGSSKVCA